ncbi:DUF305 domain-containing protein [Cryobacterium sp. CG_9.6]|uniref:DUF305 domain-containing protein n=1 Tax=Cryobacterium sp. CG_9.6 TaxID=2760710 RepID=UPI0024736B71|nr:DUF305 domain-containing protein [Cryobacterium sp. CG_9.6]MDH6237865.1 uncharacterized protein (DUF305 family) [Cryobacterium sp. CG_9.6]
MFASRKYLLIGVAIAAAATLSACSTASPSGADAPSTSASASFNDADVSFAQGMLPHHEQAVEMSDVLLAKDGIDQQVLDLATQIKAAQEPEIAQLTEWLSTWGAESTSSSSDMSGMSGMDEGMSGMMSQDDMDALDSATGTEAGTLFLEQMTMHHEGAIQMAQLELDDGTNVDAKEMATAIIKTQTDEIAVMKELLASL